MRYCGFFIALTPDPPGLRVMSLTEYCRKRSRYGYMPRLADPTYCVNREQAEALVQLLLLEDPGRRKPG